MLSDNTLVHRVDDFHDGASYAGIVFIEAENVDNIVYVVEFSVVKSGENIFSGSVATEKSSDFLQSVEGNTIVFKEA